VALNFFDCGLGFRGVEMLNGIAHEIYPVATLDEATGGAIHADFCDDAIQDDLAILAELLQQLLHVGIGENIEGLLLNNDLRVGAEIPW